jgi:hypothetical protein
LTGSGKLENNKEACEQKESQQEEASFCDSQFPYEKWGTTNQFQVTGTHMTQKTTPLKNILKK